MLDENSSNNKMSNIKQSTNCKFIHKNKIDEHENNLNLYEDNFKNLNSIIRPKRNIGDVDENIKLKANSLISEFFNGVSKTKPEVKNYYYLNRINHKFSIIYILNLSWLLRKNKNYPHFILTFIFLKCSNCKKTN